MIAEITLQIQEWLDIYFTLICISKKWNGRKLILSQYYTPVTERE